MDPTYVTCLPPLCMCAPLRRWTAQPRHVCLSVCTLLIYIQIEIHRYLHEQIIKKFLPVAVVEMSAIKKILRRPHIFIVRPAPGWSKVFSKELQLILRTPNGRYKFDPVLKPHVGRDLKISNCDFRQGMEIACRLLSVHDVEWIIAASSCRSHADLKRFMQHVPFSEIIGHCTDISRLSVQCQAHRSFADSSSLLKDAFVDQLTRAHGAIGEVDATPTSSVRPRFRILLLNNIITLSASMSGADMPLFQRGYKHITSSKAQSETNEHAVSIPAAPTKSEQLNHAVAPLPEHHAAASFMSMIFSMTPGPLSPVLARTHKAEDEATKTGSDRDWDVHMSDEEVIAIDNLKKRISHVYVPFCGTGTLGFEALLVLMGVGGGVFRHRKFAYEQFPCSPQGTVNYVRRAQVARVAVYGLNAGGDQNEVTKMLTECDVGCSQSGDGPTPSDCHTSVGDSGANNTPSERVTDAETDTQSENTTTIARLLIPEQSKHSSILTYVARTGRLPRIYFSDINPDAISTVTENARTFCRRMVGSASADCSSGDHGKYNGNGIGDAILQQVFATPVELDFLKCSLNDMSLPTINTTDSTNTSKRPVIALLLNPPYGNRLGQMSNPNEMYAAIARRVGEIRKYVESFHQPFPGLGDEIRAVGSRGRLGKRGTTRALGPQVMGYIVCPDTATWSAFVGTLVRNNFQVATTHFTHGGNDTRLVTFSSLTSTSHKKKDRMATEEYR